MLKKGDILRCIKYHKIHTNQNIVGQLYVLKGINGQTVYVETDGVEVAFSRTKNPDRMIPYSSIYLYDYFINIREERNNKINELIC